jgi:rhamnulokinase
LEELESLTAMRFDFIRVIGGGSQNEMLNQFSADATGRIVLAGPAEATALGNLAMQMVGSGIVASLDEARALIERSFPARQYHPKDTEKWETAYSKLQSYCGGVCRA